MKINVTIHLFFEIKNSYMFEYETGYSETKADLNTENFEHFNLEQYAEGQRKGFAQMFKVPIENVRIISRKEYEENTED